MISVSPSKRRVFALTALAALPIVLLAGCGGGGGGGGDNSNGNGTPVVSSISPVTGSATGGTIVTINGGNFGSSASGLSVKFGTVASPSITYVSSGTITATSPPGSGKVDIIVTTSAGSSVTSVNDAFTYSNDGPPPPPPI